VLIIGCDYPTRFQQIAMVDTSTGEIRERRLEHANGEARKFYASLATPARVGREATIHAPWFERRRAAYHHELGVGDAGQIRAAEVRQPKTHAREALHILDLWVQRRFPKIWIPAAVERDLRQRRRHRHRRVRSGTSGENQLPALARGQGRCRKRHLWTAEGRREWEDLKLDYWASYRRTELLQRLDPLSPSIQELDQAVKKEATSRPAAVLLREQPGVGPVTALAFVRTVGPVAGFAHRRKLVS